MLNTLAVCITLVIQHSDHTEVRQTQCEPNRKPLIVENIFYKKCKQEYLYDKPTACKCKESPTTKGCVG